MVMVDKVRSRYAPLQFVGKPQVTQFTVHIGQSPIEFPSTHTSIAAQRVDIPDVWVWHASALLGVVHAGRDHDDPRWRSLHEALQEQMGEQEVAQMISGKGQLKTISRELWSVVKLQSGIAHQRP